MLEALRASCASIIEDTERMLLVEAPEHGLDRVLGQEWLVTPDGLEEVDLTFSENSIRTIIHHYTREADVRSLEREIASLCRKTAARRT